VTDRGPIVADTAHASVPVLLTVDETADLLRTTRGAIYARVERAQLQGVIRIGLRVLFRRLDLIRWIDDLGKASR